MGTKPFGPCANADEILLKIKADSRRQAFGSRSLTASQKEESSSPIKRGHGKSRTKRGSSRHK